MKFSSGYLIAILFSILLFSSCARNPVTGKKELMLMSESQEIALGKQSDPAIVAQYGLYQDDKLQSFINEKGKEMGAISHRPELEYTFRILDSRVVNAFALPGGYIYFTRGIMAHFNNEAEFAGVLGHEIGHVTARHSAKQYSAQIAGQLGLMIGVIASEDFRQFAGDASQALGLLFLKFGRDHESQSDELGVSYSTAIGYNAHEMADFFETLNRIQERAGASIPTFLSTHPNPADRYQKVHEHSEAAQAGIDATALKVNGDKYLQMIDGIIYGDDPRQGYTDNFVFYHPELRFSFPYPRSWTLYNSPSQVQIAPEDGKALMVLSLSPEKSLSTAVSSDIEQYGYQVIESRNVNLNGYQASVSVADLEQTDPNTGAVTQSLRLLNYFIADGELVYIFRGMSQKADFNGYVNDFKETMGSFSKLTDAARINVTPVRVHVRKATRSAALQDVLMALDQDQKDFEELSIINGMQLNDTVERGTLVKTFSKVYNN